MILYAVYYYGRSLFSRSQKATGSGDGTRLWKLREMNGLQETPRSEELGSKYDLSLEDTVFPAHQISSRNHHSSSSIEKCGIMLVLKGWCFYTI